MNEKTRSRTVVTHLADLAAVPRWRNDYAALIAELSAQLRNRQTELIDTLLSGNEALQRTAFDCLRRMKLSRASVNRLHRIVASSSDGEQVSWCLMVLGWNAGIEALPAKLVERAVALGGTALRVGISIIPFVDAEVEVLERWLLRMFDEGDAAARHVVISTSTRMRDAFAEIILGRALSSSNVQIASEGVIRIWYGHFDRDTTIAMLQDVFGRFPDEDSVLSPALYCIKDRRLVEFESLVLELLFFRSRRIAIQAAETAGELFGTCARDYAKEHSQRLDGLVRDVLESYLQEPPADR